MSVPFGAPQRSATSGHSAGLDLTVLLPLGAAGAGLIAYLLAFFDAQSTIVFSAIPGLCIIAVAALAGLRLLPKAPNTLYAAAPLAAFAALELLQAVIGGGGGGILIVILVLAVLQLAAVAGVLLLEAGIIESPLSKGAQRVGSPQQGPMPQQARPGQFGRNPQQPAGPAQPGHFAAPGGWSPPGSQAQPGPFPPPGPQSGGWSPPQPGGQTPSPSGGQPKQPPQAGGPQGTQQMPHPGPPPSDS
jgi:hypothetical protein